MTLFRFFEKASWGMVHPRRSSSASTLWGSSRKADGGSRTIRRSASLAASFRFAQALYDDKDPYKRHQRFYWNSVLAGMGNRTLVRNPVSQQHSYRMNMGDKDDAMPAFAASRLIARADLTQPGKEIERAILYWQREAEGNR
jgi:hypothetical protein